jgi:hypothetical protein
MAYSDSGVLNLILSDKTLVYNYNGIPGDNFQVFYSQQAPDFIVPQSIVYYNGTHGLWGSPVAGLTNQQNWAQYGIAIAGEVAPPTATTRAGIDGLVNRF